MSKFLSTSNFKWKDLKELELNKCTNNGSTGCVLEFDFENPKELHKLLNDYHLPPDKLKIKNKCYLLIN